MRGNQLYLVSWTNTEQESMESEMVSADNSDDAISIVISLDRIKIGRDRYFKAKQVEQGEQNG